jgi:hypothetical protein
MKRIYVINSEYRCEKYDIYEKGSKSAFNDLEKAKARLKTIANEIITTIKEKYDEDDIEIEETEMSCSAYLAYRYDEYHEDVWIDEVEVED